MSDETFGEPVGGGGLDNAEYGGFFIRLVAYLIDGVILWVIQFVIAMIGFVGASAATFDPMATALSLVVGIVYFVGFWSLNDATPGKMAFGLVVVDGETGRTAGAGRYFLRYIGYIVSTLIIFIGFIMVAFTDRNRGLHDMIAGTVVVKKDSLG